MDIKEIFSVDQIKAWFWTVAQLILKIFKISFDKEANITPEDEASAVAGL